MYPTNFNYQPRQMQMQQPAPQPAPPNPRPMDGPIPMQAPMQPRWMNGPGGTQPQSFAGAFGPQIQQIQQRFPGFANQARQQWQQARQQQGPGFWRNYMQPGGGGQEMFPGFLNLFQGIMGQGLPPRFMNIAQNRGWAPQQAPQQQRWFDY